MCGFPFYVVFSWNSLTNMSFEAEFSRFYYAHKHFIKFIIKIRYNNNVLWSVAWGMGTMKMEAFPTEEQMAAPRLCPLQ